MMTGHAIMGFALVAFLITVIFIVISAKLDIRSHSRGCLDYRLDSEASSIMTGHAIMGFALVAFLITVIFICNLLSCAGHVMCQRNDCRFKTPLVT